MTAKADFTTEEWTSLLRMPWLAGILVIISDPSVGVANEVRAMGRAVDGLEQEGPAAALIAELVADTNQWEPELTDAPTEQATAEMLDELGSAFDLATDRCSAEEVEHLRRWVLAIATETAKAEREGGFLGGARVSGSERAVLEQIEARLSPQA